MHPALSALVGGLLIGLASWLLLAALGRVAGISGITASVLHPSPNEPNGWRIAFLGGLVLGGALFTILLSTPTTLTRSTPLLIIAGLLVGVGTVLGAGCTSGHGVCGLGRRSGRSLVATLVFMGAAVATVAVVNLLKG